MKPLKYKSFNLLKSQRKPHPYDIAIGQNILRMRNNLGYSQDACAEAIGVSFQQFGRYELGGNRISGSRMAMLADFFGCHAGDFFDGVGEPKKKSIAAQILGAVDMRAAHAYQALPSAKQKQAVLNLMRAMAQADSDE